MIKDNFIFYREYAESIEPLPAEEAKEVIDAISHYALDDTEIEIKGSGSKAVFRLIKTKIDKNKQRAKNGQNGGRPKEDNKPRKEFKGFEDINITEEQFQKLINKYGEEKVMKMIARFDGWLAKRGKSARQYLGKNHYAHFRIDNWFVKQVLAEEQQKSQPNWSV